MKAMRFVVAVCALVLVASPDDVVAQRAPSIGTATALGGVGVVGARRADALLWNAGALGVWEGGPVASFAVLEFDGAALPSGEWFDRASRVGLLGGPAVSRDVVEAFPRGSGDLEGGSASLTWLAVQSRGLALSVGTYADVVGPLAAGDSVVRETAREVATIAAVGYGSWLGALPVLGSFWGGAVVKGGYIHDYARGVVSGERESAVYAESGIEGVPFGGVDLGVVGWVGQGVWYGVAISNALHVLGTPDVVRDRVAAVDGAGVTVTSRELGAADAGAVEGVRAERALEEAGYPAVLRGGIMVERAIGGLGVSVSRSLVERGVGNPVVPFSLAVVRPFGVPLRGSVGWGDGRRDWSVGGVWGGERSVAAAVGRSSGESGSAVAASVSVTWLISQ